MVSDSYHCAQALKEDLAIWQENGAKVKNSGSSRSMEEDSQTVAN